MRENRCFSQRSKTHTMATGFALYQGVGEVLTQYDVNVETAELTRRGSVSLPGNVQYVWPHPSRKYFYVSTTEIGRAHV